MHNDTIEKITLMETHNKELLEDFKKLSLDTKEVVILEEVSYMLEDIENELYAIESENYIAESDYVFEYEDTCIINMFLDETGRFNVNPIENYGLDTIKNSKLISVMKSVIKDNYNNIVTIENLNDIAEDTVRSIIEELNIPYEI